MSIFDGSQVVIGRGAQATVYLYRGSAYKVYKEDYPAAWISVELHIQQQLAKTDLPVVTYFPTPDPHILKMDYIPGKTLGDRVRTDRYKNGIVDMLVLQKSVHSHTQVPLAPFTPWAEGQLANMDIDPRAKARALEFLADIPQQPNLLHLDFHLLNILHTGQQYYIIDWVNAKTGNPIYDFARSYVILHEFVYRLSSSYLSRITKDRDIDMTHFQKALYIMALLRLKEHRSKKTLALLAALEAKLLT